MAEENTNHIAKFIEVRAVPRYWEDSKVDGVADENGTLIPFRRGDAWCPVIELATGRIVGWPEGKTASVHYKVCDEGEYWLLDESGVRVAKYADYYVPDRFLCHGDRGFGDNIILNINEQGAVEGWRTPVIDPGMWPSMEGGK